MDDSYLTVARRGTAEIKVRGSRFLAVAEPVSSEEEIADVLGHLRRQWHDARHHCFAYRLGPTGDEFRANDDGEPSGTAGPPILQQIRARDLTGTLVVVTRYFGGTKLGRGGLVRAYGDAASQALEAAGRRVKVLLEQHLLEFAYDDTALAMRLIDEVGGTILRSDYSDVTSLVVVVRRAESRSFCERFVDRLGGRGTIRVLGEGESAPTGG